MFTPPTNFSSNYGGRLFGDTFSDVRDNNTEKFYVGATHEIVLKGKNIGIAEIVSVRKFYFKDIRDTLSYLITGQPSYYLAGMLNRFYNQGKPLEPTEVLLHVVYKWKKRNLEMQQFLLNEWWIDLCQQQAA
jgi:hypothetical protein